MQMMWLVIALSLCIFAVSASIPDFPADLQALDQFFASTSGNQWKRSDQWSNASASFCLRFGVSCNCTSQPVCRVTALSLSNNNLAGTLPLSIGNLTSLIDFDVSYNSLSSTVPETFFQLGSLRTVSLAYNSFSGSISASLGNLNQVETLALNSNQFGGPLPQSIGSLAALRTLHIYSNQFTALPASLGNCQSLQFIDASFNKLSSSLASEWSGLYSLIQMDLSNNQMTGSIPSDWCLNWSSIRTLSLTKNQLSGSLPVDIGMLTSLQFLDVSFNQLSGELPISIVNLTVLSTLDISYNLIQGCLPSQMGRMRSLRQLFAPANQLNGTLPVDLCSLEMLESINFFFNQFSSTIPSCISDLKRLTNLDLSSNSLVGHVPVDWPPALQSLNLNTNQLSSSIPAGLCRLHQLQLLDISSNQFSGSIPTECDQLLQLQSFAAQYNQLSGSLSAAFVKLPLLQSIDVSMNRFNSSLPLSFNESKSLTSLILTGNKFFGSLPNFPPFIQTVDVSMCMFSGTIPDQFGSLKYIQSAKFQNNHLSGAFSVSSSLIQLNYLDISMNQISGPVPSMLFSLPSLLHLNLSYNKFWSSLPDAFSGSQLSLLDISYSAFVGHLPLSLGTQASNLISLIMDGNSLLEWPNSMRGLVSLQTLSASGNFFRMFPPSDLALASQLSNIDLSNSNIAGSLPLWLFCNNSLMSLDLSRNHLSGRLPACSVSIQYMDLSHNLMTETIPDEFSFNGLNLRLASNRLVGSLPAVLCNSQLQVLDVSDNALNSSLNACLNNVSSSLQVVNASNNQFTMDLTSVMPSVMPFNNLSVIILDNNVINGDVSSLLTSFPASIRVSAAQNQLRGSVKLQSGQPLSVLNVSLNPGIQHSSLASAAQMLTILDNRQHAKCSDTWNFDLPHLLIEPICHFFSVNLATALIGGPMLLCTIWIGLELKSAKQTLRLLLFVSAINIVTLSLIVQQTWIAPPLNACSVVNQWTVFRGYMPFTDADTESVFVVQQPSFAIWFQFYSANYPTFTSPFNRAALSSNNDAFQRLCSALDSCAVREDRCQLVEGSQIDVDIKYRTWLFFAACFVLSFVGVLEFVRLFVSTKSRTVHMHAYWYWPSLLGLLFTCHWSHVESEVDPFASAESRVYKSLELIVSSLIAVLFALHTLSGSAVSALFILLCVGVCLNSAALLLVAFSETLHEEVEHQMLINQAEEF